MKNRVVGNPFRIHGLVGDDFFTDRDDELKRLVRALTDPGSKLLVYSPRRMGKTSAIMKAVDTVNKSGGHAFLVDLSTASTAVDMGNRILAAASRILGKKWKNFISDIVTRLNVTISLTPDSTTGIPLPSIDINLRGEEIGKQRQTFSNVLDAINETAGERKITVGMALDEFQEIHKFGGETAEWDFRASIQQHGNIGYVLSGSREHLIQRMVNNKGALYKLVDKLPFGPINPRHMAEWIDKRMSDAGIEIQGVGDHIVHRTGGRTRDIVQVARRCYDRAVSVGSASVEDVEHAFEDIIFEEHDLLYACWLSLTAHQQNVLRAVAAGNKGLTTRETLNKFTLGSSGTVINTVNSLIKAGHLIRQDPYTREKVTTPTGYDFDSPFFKEWVIRYTLSDIGLP
ncbi:MAG: ATP-binding protein [Deltaproteobacteria bacterium]|nr:ATP-binding protein [Deltaproteobacteria bacterium]